MHVEDLLTYGVITTHQKVIFLSGIRTAMNLMSPNPRVSTTEGEMKSNKTGDKRSILSNWNSQILDDGSCDRKAKLVAPKELVGSSFLTKATEDGQRF
jgi:hypothetical protein